MHGRLASAALCAMLLLVPAATASAANDSYAEAKPLFLGTVDDTVSNAAGTIQPGETLTTLAAADRNACVRNETGTEFSRVDRTMWWFLIGTGRPVTVTTDGSSFDTHVGIFGGPVDGDAGCQDAKGVGESLTFASAAGQLYRVQVGGCVENVPLGCGLPLGQIRLLATSAAAGNDGRGAAASLPTGQVVSGDNYAATEETGEPVACGGQPYGRTVWYRWTSAGVGSAVFAVSGLDASIAVLTQAGVPLGCDAASGGDARLAMDVARGEYLVQVGGIGAHAGLSGDSAQGPFNVRATFTASNDRDADGVPNARDCKPDDPGVHPGARDAPRNGVDEDCSGSDAEYPRIAARARLGVALFAGYAKVTSISARNVPAGARVQLRCSGRSCPFRRTRTRTIRRARTSVSLMSSALRAARIVPKTTLEVRVTRAGRIGRVMRFRFTRRGAKPSLLTRCLVPGTSRPRRC